MLDHDIHRGHAGRIINVMKEAIDGLDSPQLIHDIVEELALEFPTLDVEELTRLVQDCKAHIARPATGGSLFLVAMKLAQVQEDERAAAQRLHSALAAHPMRL